MRQKSKVKFQHRRKVIFGLPERSELKSLFEKDLIADTKALVKHIPVIAVSEGNPANIMSPQDLAELGEYGGGRRARSTPIGKIGNSFRETGNCRSSKYYCEYFVLLQQ